MAEWPTVHACAVLVGARALLIRGPAGSGKSQLAFKLIAAAQSGSCRSRASLATTEFGSSPATDGCWRAHLTRSPA